MTPPKHQKRCHIWQLTASRSGGPRIWERRHSEVFHGTVSVRPGKTGSRANRANRWRQVATVAIMDDPRQAGFSMNSMVMPSGSVR